jgi:type 1 glutamine amidotransferase
MRLSLKTLVAFASLLAPVAVSAQDETDVQAKPAGESELWIEFKGGKGPGAGKHIVFVTGDEEYRSEEGMVQLAKILSKHHGFRCTVTFAIDKKTGTINPNISDNIPGLEALDKADLMVILTRFRDLPDDQMKHIVDYVESGRPIVGLRTSTHAFQFRKHKTYKKYQNSKEWPGGFGRQVLGEKWIAHHGGHKTESCRGIVVEGMKDHPILAGIKPKGIWDPADVYRVRLPMLEGIQPLVLGQNLRGMKPDDEPLKGKTDGEPHRKNNPMMPVAWIKTFSPSKGKKARVFASTMGSAPAFTQEGSRRLMVNACYWAIGLEDKINADSNVSIVGKYKPSMFGFNAFKKGVKPADLR